MGYLLWIFGFTGSHRFYYGKTFSGSVYFFTFGLLGIGWLIDLLLIPAMDQQADRKYLAGEIDYDLAWIFLVFLGIFGVHRFYIKKWISGLIWLCTGGLLTIGILYDFFTLNDQIDELHQNSSKTLGAV